MDSSPEPDSTNCGLLIQTKGIIQEKGRTPLHSRVVVWRN